MCLSELAEFEDILRTIEVAVSWRYLIVDVLEDIFVILEDSTEP